MIAEAEDRRDHLAGHLADIDAGREPEPRAGGPRAAPAGAAGPMTADTTRAAPSPGGFALANGGRAFRHRNYRLFFGGQLVSLVGTWMQQVAQAWLVLELTNDPLILGLTTALAFLPGAHPRPVRRADRRRPPQAADADHDPGVQMTLAFILFGAVGHRHRAGVAHPRARDHPRHHQRRGHADPPGVHRRDGRPRGRAPTRSPSTRAIFNGARIVGPAIAGLTIGLFGGDVEPRVPDQRAELLRRDPRLPRDARGRAPPRGLVHPAALDRARCARRSRTACATSATTTWSCSRPCRSGVVSTFGMNFGVIIPALARVVLDSDATGYGFLMAATGIGSLVAALGIAFSGRSRPAIIPLGAIVLGVALLATSLVHVFAVAMVTMMFVGFGAIAMAATANTTVQLAVPDELRGRVISVYTTVFVGSTPLGGLLMGWIASSVSVDAAIAVGGRRLARRRPGRARLAPPDPGPPRRPVDGRGRVPEAPARADARRGRRRPAPGLGARPAAPVTP